jgi:hypothetical protein
MNTSRWLSWKPREPIFRNSPGNEPTKPTKLPWDGSERHISLERAENQLKEPLRGRVVELYLIDGDRLSIVADGADAVQLEEPRGTVYTVAEVRRVIQIADPSVVAEVHRWQGAFNAEMQKCLRGPKTNDQSVND